MENKTKTVVDSKNLPSLTIGECQEIFDRYNINTSEHDITTSRLCMVIKEIERKVGQHRVELMLQPDGYSIGV